MNQTIHIKGRLQLPLLRSAPILCLVGLIFVPFNRPVQAAAPAAQPTSAAAAAAWLALLDNGEYAKSWDAGADIFRKEVTKDQWVASSKSIRQPLGALISRKVSSVKEMEDLPGLPPGSYWVGQFA